MALTGSLQRRPVTLFFKNHFKKVGRVDAKAAFYLTRDQGRPQVRPRVDVIESEEKYSSIT